jgi:hypothetical protein
MAVEVIMVARIGIVMHPGVHLPGVHDHLALLALMGKADDVNDLYGHVLRLLSIPSPDVS